MSRASPTANRAPLAPDLAMFISYANKGQGVILPVHAMVRMVPQSTYCRNVPKVSSSWLDSQGCSSEQRNPITEHPPTQECQEAQCVDFFVPRFVYGLPLPFVEKLSRCVAFPWERLYARTVVPFFLVYERTRTSRLLRAQQDVLLDEVRV